MRFRLLTPLIFIILLSIGQGLSPIRDERAKIFSSGNGYYCLKIFPLKFKGHELIATPIELCRVSEECELITLKKFPGVGEDPLGYYMVSNDGKFFLNVITLLPGLGKKEFGVKYDVALEIYFTDGAARKVPPSVFGMTPENEKPDLTNRLWCNSEFPVYLDNNSVLHLETVDGQKWTYDVGQGQGPETGGSQKIGLEEVLGR